MAISNTTTLPAKKNKSLKLFISYAREDKRLLSRLLVHLEPLIRSGTIERWYDQLIYPGSEWSNEIEKNIDSADVIIFLISPDLLASRYITEIEIPKALDLREKGQVRILPVLLKHCLLEHSIFAKLQIFPGVQKPLSSFRDRDKAFSDLVKLLTICSDVQAELN